MKKISIKKAIIILVLLGAVGVAIVFVLARNKPSITYTTAPIERGTIIQTVSETGTVKSADEVDLSFALSGRISKISCKIGDRIIRGVKLAELDCGDYYIKKNQAQANLDSARASYNKLLSGATREDIAVVKAGVQQAKNGYEAASRESEKVLANIEENIRQAKKNLADLENKTAVDITSTEQAVITAENNLENTILNYQRAIDNDRETALTTVTEKLAIANNALDVLRQTIDSEDLKNVLSIKDRVYLDNAEKSYAQAVLLLATANDSLAMSRNITQNDYAENMHEDALLALKEIFSSLQYCYGALENTVASADVDIAELDVFQAGITAQQTLISSAISIVQSSKQRLDQSILSYDMNVGNAENALKQALANYEDSLKAARNALSSAQTTSEQATASAESGKNSAYEAWQVAVSRYNQVIAPTNAHDLQVAGAQVKQAEAAIASVENSITDCSLVSPIDGTVTKIHYEPGEQAMGGVAALSLLGEDNFDIELLISEADIAKVNNDDLSEITLDAFGEDLKLKGKISFIEPAETVIQDVIYYKVTVVFSDINDGSYEKDGQAYNIKSGMTANVVITTNQTDNVLVIPSRAIIDRNGQGKFARILTGPGVVEERKIMIGLRGDDGQVELVSGAKEGELVVTFVKEEGK